MAAIRSAAALTALGTLLAGAPALAQNDERVELTVATGTPLRVALDETIAVTHVGQAVGGTLVEPLYAYDRVVLPAGAHVVGHVTSLDDPSRFARIRAWSSGDFSPKRRVVIQFDAVVHEQETTAVSALGRDGVVNARRFTAPASQSQDEQEHEGDGTAARARHAATQRISESVGAAKQKASEAIANIKEPDKAERVKPC